MRKVHLLRFPLTFIRSGRCLALCVCVLSLVSISRTQNEPDMAASGEVKSEVIANILQQFKK